MRLICAYCLSALVLIAGVSSASAAGFARGPTAIVLAPSQDMADRLYAVTVTIQGDDWPTDTRVLIHANWLGYLDQAHPLQVQFRDRADRRQTLDRIRLRPDCDVPRVLRLGLEAIRWRAPR